MILYWCSGAGWGHANRAAAICAHLPDATVLVDMNTDPLPLIHHHIPFIRVTSRHLLDQLVHSLHPRVIIFDGQLGEHWMAQWNYRGPWVHIWRYGRLPTQQATLNVSVDVMCPDGYDHYFPVLAPHSFPTRAESRITHRISLDTYLVLAVQPILKRIIGNKVANQIATELDGTALLYHHYPVTSILPAADMVVGTCGLNLFSEVSYLGLDARWLSLSPEQAERAQHVPPVDPYDRTVDLALAIGSLL